MPSGFEVSNAGQIDLGFIPGLEEVPQSSFVAFLEIAFSTPNVPLTADNAFAIHVDGGFTPFNSSRSVLVRVGIQGRFDNLYGSSGSTRRSISRRSAAPIH